MPELSVIIPTYKRTDSLDQILDCLQKQEDIEIEIIVVDQNEPGFFDNKLILKLGKVIHIIQEVPNVSIARNTGFKRSTAPYILFLDDDLIPTPVFCRKGIDIFKNYSLIKSFIPLVYTHEGEASAFLSVKRKMVKYYPEQTLIFSVTDAISAAVFFERSYFELTGGFDVHLFDFAKTSEDQEFFLRMKQRGLSLWFVPFIEIYHDEKIAGGCDLRTYGYWETRKKCIKAIAYRRRIHKKKPGNLSITDLIHIARSSVLNRKVIFSGALNILKETKIMIDSIKESKYFFLEHSDKYSGKDVSFI